MKVERNTRKGVGNKQKNVMKTTKIDKLFATLLIAIAALWVVLTILK